MVFTNLIPAFYCCWPYFYLMRLSDIVTRTGDKGETGLADGRRVLKNHPYIEAIGAVDSLNSILGWAIVPGTDNLVDELEKIQQDLFNLGAELALPSLKGQKLKQDRLDWLDMRIEKMNENLPVLDEFIIPGGTEFSARLHLVRTECRYVERILVAVSQTETVPEFHLSFLNRLSDYLFVLARVVQSKVGKQEKMWQNKK